MNVSTLTVPCSQTRPRSLRPRSTSMTCSARSFSSASRPSAIWASWAASAPRGRGPGDLEVQEVQEVHVRAGVDDAQPPVDRERVDVDARAPALRRDDLEG